MARVDLLNQQLLALRRQIAALNEALGASEKKTEESDKTIKDLGTRLNAALAREVQELQRYRSDFFGRLRETLKDRKDIRVVGDRFVFESEVLFPSGAATLTPEGLSAMDQMAAAIVDLDKQIPKEIDWALQIDGHTDARPISSAVPVEPRELWTTRASSVSHRHDHAAAYRANRPVADGYGEFRPLEGGTSDDALKKNRRIELKLDEQVAARSIMLRLREVLPEQPVAPERFIAGRHSAQLLGRETGVLAHTPDHVPLVGKP